MITQLSINKPKQLINLTLNKNEEDLLNILIYKNEHNQNIITLNELINFFQVKIAPNQINRILNKYKANNIFKQIDYHKSEAYYKSEAMITFAFEDDMFVETEKVNLGVIFDFSNK